MVTGSRADYGLLRPLLAAIAGEPGMELVLAATGAHLAATRGMTISELAQDEWPVRIEVAVDLRADDRSGMVAAMGHTMLGFADRLLAHSPDIVVVLGDRYEIFAVAACAYTLGLPLAHIHGGEITVGALDDAYRHAITKFSHLHFTATDAYRRRVIQLGEDPERVFTVGAIGLDSLRSQPVLGRAEAIVDLGLPAESQYVIVTIHPETAGLCDGTQIVDGLFRALAKHTEFHVVATGANADAGGQAINEALARWQAADPDRIRLFHSLGQRRYLAAMRHAKAVVGNSSSGIIEAPSAHVPSLDIGMRQQGRVCAESVIHCDATDEGIEAGLRAVLSAQAAEIAARCANPYDFAGATDRIMAVLRSTDVASLSPKRFHDL